MLLTQTFHKQRSADQIPRIGTSVLLSNITVFGKIIPETGFRTRNNNPFYVELEGSPELLRARVIVSHDEDACSNKVKEYAELDNLEVLYSGPRSGLVRSELIRDYPSLVRFSKVCLSAG